MTEKSYSRMNLAELRETADALGIAYNEEATKAELLSAITALVNGASDEPELEAEVVGDVVKGEKRVTIIIAEDKSDKQPVQVGVNGRVYLMKRGEPVSVPESVLHVLNNSVEDQWNSDMTERVAVPCYNYRTVV